MRANETYTASPTRNDGIASARLGHIRVRISWPMLRPSSALPKSNAKSFADFSKKIVSVRRRTPSFASFQSSGRS